MPALRHIFLSFSSRTAPSAWAVMACLILALVPAPTRAQIQQEDLSDSQQNGGERSAELAQLERLAEESFGQNDLETAVALYRQLLNRLEVRSEKVRILMIVAWLEHLRHFDAEALDALTEAFVIEPDFQFRPELYSETFRQLFYQGQSRAALAREQRAADRVSLGFSQLRKRDYPAARASLEEALSLVPNQPRGLFNLALVNLYEQRSDEAVAGFQKVLALADGGVDIEPTIRAHALTNLGYLYNQQENYLDAEKALEDAVTVDAGNSSTWSNLGVTRRRLGKKQAAAEAFRQAYKLSPDDAGVINNTALAYIDAEDWVSAVALLREATARFPDNASLWLNLGLAQMNLGNDEGAIESFEQAIQRDPDDQQGWASAATIHLAQHAYEQGRPEAALAAADRALAWRSDLVNGWIYRGLAHKALGDSASAVESLEKARTLDPSRAGVHNNLGSAYADLGRVEDARAAFERALNIDPNFVDAQQNLARTKSGSGSRTTARTSTRPASGSSTSNSSTSNSRTSNSRTSGKRPAQAEAQAKAPPLGIRFADIDYSSLGLKGAMIEAVNRGGVAERGGLRSGDLILKLDGNDVTGVPQLKDYVASRSRGDQVTIDFLRSNVPQRLVLTLK